MASYKPDPRQDPRSADDALSYERDYEPAYRFGWESHSRYVDRQWEDVQDELQHDWELQRDTSKLSWDQAREACQNAWDHYLRELPASDQPGLEQEPPSQK